jgi:hypothetical protein
MLVEKVEGGLETAESMIGLANGSIRKKCM